MSAQQATRIGKNDAERVPAGKETPSGARPSNRSENV